MGELSLLDLKISSYSKLHRTELKGWDASLSIRPDSITRSVIKGKGYVTLKFANVNKASTVVLRKQSSKFKKKHIFIYTTSH